MTAPTAATSKPANEPAPTTATLLPADEAADEVAAAAPEETAEAPDDLADEAAEVAEDLAAEADCERSRARVAMIKEVTNKAATPRRWWKRKIMRNREHTRKNR